MTIIDLIGETLTSPSVIIIGVLSLIEVVPVRINPWTKLFSWVGHSISDAVVGDIKDDLAETKQKVSEFKRDFEQTKANDMRWNILNFANSCRRGEKHGKDEWRHVMAQIAEYEEYTEEKGIVNGVIDEDSKFLRELYHSRNFKNDFLYKGEGQE